MRLVWNIVLAIFWAALWGSISLRYLCFGFVIGYGVLSTLESAQLIENRFYGRRIWSLLWLLCFFCKKLLCANLAVARDVLRRNPQFLPGIVKVPLDLREDYQIALLANVISLTPGTLSLDVSPDKSHLYVHAMFCHDRDKIVRDIKDGFERRLKELFAE